MIKQWKRGLIRKWKVRMLKHGIFLALTIVISNAAGEEPSCKVDEKDCNSVSQGWEDENPGPQLKSWVTQQRSKNKLVICRFVIYYMSRGCYRLYLDWLYWCTLHVYILQGREGESRIDRECLATLCDTKVQHVLRNTSEYKVPIWYSQEVSV